MLTGDENIVDAEMIVQYKIKDPVAYTFNFIKPELTVREASEASLRTVDYRKELNLILKSKIKQSSILNEEFNNILDKYNKSSYEGKRRTTINNDYKTVEYSIDEFKLENYKHIEMMSFQKLEVKVKQ